MQVFEVEPDEKTILIYLPNFFQAYNVKERLFEIDNWRGQSERDTRWAPPRLQRWSHLESKPFHSKWDPRLDRWQPVEYEDWLLDFQTQFQADVEILSLVYKFKMPHINSVLINHYTDANSSIHLHQDCIPEFGSNPTILTASFGATRTLDLIRVIPRDEPGKFTIDTEKAYLNRCFDLEDGSLFIMAGTCQKYYAHTIAKTSEVSGSRISCIFREHM